MEVFVLRDCAGRTLENLARNPRASVNVTEPPTYRSIQFKGSARLSEPPDLQFCAQQLMRLETAFMAVGLPPTAARQMVSRSVGDLGEAELAEYVCIELSVDSAYDQSPKVGAGARLG
jgi:hypothetical protein